MKKSSDGQKRQNIFFGGREEKTEETREGGSGFLFGQTQLKKRQVIFFEDETHEGYHSGRDHDRNGLWDGLATRR